MCRIVAYFGPPVRLADVVMEPPHGLLHQSRAAREMEDGSVAGDGWGVGWFDPEAGVGLLKSILPLWSDENAKTTLPAIRSGSFVGHVRFASPGVEVCFTNTPVYSYEERVYTHNGGLTPWPGPLGKAIRDRLDPEDEAAVRGSTDSEMLGALWRTCLRRARPRDPAAALREALGIARDLALDHGGEIKASLILAHASGFVAARFADPGPPPTLYLLSDGERWPGATLVASEPLDEGPGWEEVPPSSLVRADAQGVRVEPLDLEERARRSRRRTG